jgi:cysteinyl-tRNA synthetase
LRRHVDAPVTDLPVEQTAVFAALLDDLNTPEAMAALHGAATTLNKTTDPNEVARAKAELIVGGGLLGLLQADPEAWFKASLGAEGLSADQIDALIQERLEARAGRDFARADEIRDALEAQGVLLDDGPDGTQWRRRG